MGWSLIFEGVDLRPRVGLLGLLLARLALTFLARGYFGSAVVSGLEAVGLLGRLLLLVKHGLRNALVPVLINCRLGQRGLRGRTRALSRTVSVEQFYGVLRVVVAGHSLLRHGLCGPFH